MDVVGEAVVDWFVTGLAIGLFITCCTDTVCGCVVDCVGVAGEVELIGLTGLVGFVGLLRDFLQVSDIVTQGANIGCPYGSGHEEVRVWVIKPI